MRLAGIGLLLSLLASAASASTPLPTLERAAGATRLLVDGRPFLVQGGEVGNSRGEPDSLRASWPKFRELHLNTLLVPVYWDVIEPREGSFDFGTVDGLLADARASGMRLVLLWFGSWKNSMSCYVPGWVKTDTARFPRARDSQGEPMEILTAFADANRDTDARAFAALMRHLREADGEQHTVILVQVENEIGMIPEARDRYPAADASFAGQVPAGLMDYLAAHRDTAAPELRERWAARGARAAGTWEEVFGEGPATAELFTAWSFARYVEKVAAAGRIEYPIPLYANAALIRPAFQPGQYPSGGPLPHLIDIWRAGAPTLDFISPDIYFPNFAEWAGLYVRGGNPLFIPEALGSAEAAVNNLYAFGACGAIGFSPFAIDSIEDPAAGLLSASNDLIAQLTPLILANGARGRMTALLPPAGDQREPREVAFGGLVLEATYEFRSPPNPAAGPGDGAVDRPPAPPPPPSGAILIQLGPDELLIGGTGVTVTFSAPLPGDPLIGILDCEEGRYEAGQWRHLRWLNGDQTHQGRHIRLESGRFTLQRVRLYRYR